jgi:hypothetical protein
MHYRKGQSLIETTIALGVIITGLAGAITLIAFSLRGSGTSLSRLIALQLSWEGIEAAANMRDSNYLSGDPFETGLAGGTDQTAIAVFDTATGNWTFDFTPNVLSDDATILYQQGGVYRQALVAPAGVASPYRRLLILDTTTPDEIRVISTVQWREGSATRQVRAERVLYNWR